MKILFLGHCSYYTVGNFAAALKEKYSDLNITVADPVKPGGKGISEEEGKVFDEVIYFPKRKDAVVSAGDIFKSFSETIKDHTERSKFFRKLFRLRFKAAAEQIEKNAKEKVFSEQIRNIFMNFDIFHFHYLSPDYLSAIRFIPENKKILLTFWGSDLYQVSGVSNYNKQFEGLHKADLITVNALEIKEAVLTKFGRDLNPKLRDADFRLSKSKLERIEQRKKENANSSFKQKHGIPEEKIIVTLGYSASSKQKHIEILKILNEFDEKYKSRIFVLIPMTYGLEHEDEDYLEKVKDVCNKINLETKILEDYLVDDELVDFIISSEITLNLRDTDALNAAMLESLFAGNIVVNGAWLPYGKLRRLGIHYREIENIMELKSLIPEILDNQGQEKERALVNPEIIRKNFLYENTISEWKNIYDELYTGQSRNMK
jgi:hypothetical protein